MLTHCPKCEGPYTYPASKKIPLGQLNQRFDDLEQQLNYVHQSIEHDYMEQGREVKESCHTRIFDLMRDYQDAWGLFMDWLRSLGDPTLVIDEKGNAIASYSNNTARIYLIKINHLLYQSLQELAQASHWLGRASRGNIKDVDDLLNASVALQSARDRVRDHLQEIRFAATTRFD